MAIEELLATVARAAEAEAARAGAAAIAQVAAIERESAARIARERAAAAERRAARDAAAIRSGLAAVERLARERTLAARAAAVDRVFAAARERLESLPLERYRDRLGALVGETVRYLEGRPAALVCRPEVARAAGAVVPDSGEIRLEPDPSAAPGILGRADDRSVIVDGTFPARLERRRAELAIALVARMEERDHAVG